MSIIINNRYVSLFVIVIFLIIVIVGTYFYNCSSLKNWKKSIYEIYNDINKTDIEKKRDLKKKSKGMKCLDFFSFVIALSNICFTVVISVSDELKIKEDVTYCFIITTGCHYILNIIKNSFYDEYNNFFNEKIADIEYKIDKEQINISKEEIDAIINMTKHEAQVDVKTTIHISDDYDITRKKKEEKNNKKRKIYSKR